MFGDGAGAVIVTKNEEESDKIGVYSIQVMTDEAMPEGFKWREEDSVPGIFN